MSLLEDIKKEIANKKPTKAELLLEKKEEIDLMLENNIPLTKQVELILKNGILEKLNMSEYKKIIKKHFDYTPKFTRNKKTVTSTVQTENNKNSKPSNPKIQKEKLNTAKDAKEFLSQEINLY